ncbi:MAG: hypothetical protein GY791_14190 [Alphaproteobacteria bacterium]|nr:hypothetical protein [Alphaproteobacteria bacterium]
MSTTPAITPRDDRATLKYTAALFAAAAAAGIAGYAVIGWLGVGLVGLFGLWFVNDHRMVQSDEDGDIAYPDYRRTPYADALYEQARANHLRQLAAEGKRQEDIAAERAFLRYLKNTVFLSVMAFGLGMTMLHG